MWCMSQIKYSAVVSPGEGVVNRKKVIRRKRLSVVVCMGTHLQQHPRPVDDQTGKGDMGTDHPVFDYSAIKSILKVSPKIFCLII